MLPLDSRDKHAAPLGPEELRDDGKIALELLRSSAILGQEIS